MEDATATRRPRPGRSWRVLGLGNTYPPELSGGYAQVSADIMEGLAARGHRPTMLVSQRPDLNEGGQPRDRGVEVRRELGYVLACWRRPLQGLRATKHDEPIIRQVIADGVDVVLVWHMRGVMKPSLRLLHDAGVPVIYMHHDRWILYERAGPWLRPWPVIDRLGFAAARELFGRWVSPRVELRAPPAERDGWNYFVGAWLERALYDLGYRPLRRGLIHCGIDLERFGEDAYPAPMGEPRRILFAGRLDPSKGLDVAIDALARSRTPYTMRVAGPVDSPGFEQQVRAQAEQLGVADRIEWLGELPREQVFRELAQTDVLVYPSRTIEAYSLGLLEAMAARRLIVTSAPGGPRDYLRHETNALVHEPGDVGALANALDRLAAEPELRARLIAGGRATAEAHSLERICDQVEEAIELAIESPRQIRGAGRSRRARR
jgi:glycosyltransferase involved in cell wall biosynthesis